MDEKGQPLDGAEFSFAGSGNGSAAVSYSLTGTSSGTAGMVSWVHAAESSKNEGTTASSPGAAWGTYTVAETKAPDGYEMDDAWKTGQSVTLCYTTNRDSLTVSGMRMIYRNGPDPYVTVANTKIPVTPVKIIKADMTDPTKLLSGAKFSVVYTAAGADSGEGGEKPGAAQGQTSVPDGSTWTSGSGEDLGIMYSGSLPYGTYTLTESRVPDGYSSMSGTVTVTVAENSVTYSQTDNGGGQPQTAPLQDSSKPVSPDNPYVVTICANPGVELPETGGSGRFPYTLGGAVFLTAAALMYGFRKRRRERRSDISL